MGFFHVRRRAWDPPSMKVPPKRKGNLVPVARDDAEETLNESPSEKEGKYRRSAGYRTRLLPSMKVPPKRKGNLGALWDNSMPRFDPSMKVPPKRKENYIPASSAIWFSSPQ